MLTIFFENYVNQLNILSAGYSLYIYIYLFIYSFIKFRRQPVSGVRTLVMTVSGNPVTGLLSSAQYIFVWRFSVHDKSIH